MLISVAMEMEKLYSSGTIKLREKQVDITISKNQALQILYLVLGETRAKCVSNNIVRCDL